MSQKEARIIDTSTKVQYADRDSFLCTETDPFDLITTEDDEPIIVGHTNDWTKINRN